MSADRRVLRRLVDLDDRYAGSPIPFTQADLAELAGTTRTTVNRTLRDASGRGFVQLGRGAVEVRDRTALERLAR